MDYEELSGALDESLRLCHSVNEAVRSKENTEQLEWLQTNVQFSLDEVKYYTVEQIHIFLLASVLEKLHLYHIQYEEKNATTGWLDLHTTHTYSITTHLVVFFFFSLYSPDTGVQLADQFHGPTQAAALGEIVQGAVEPLNRGAPWGH